jgi:hypothetical protein
LSKASNTTAIRCLGEPDQAALCRRRVAQSGMLQRGCFWLDQLDPVSKGIIDEDSVVTLQRLVVGKGTSGGFQSRGERRQIIDDEGRVSLSGRDEIYFHPEVNLQLAVFEPATAAGGQLRRLDRLRYAEDALVEFPGVGFSAGRHREQDVIQSANAHRCSPLCPRKPALLDLVSGGPAARPGELVPLKHRVLPSERIIGGPVAGRDAGYSAGGAWPKLRRLKFANGSRAIDGGGAHQPNFWPRLTHVLG